MKKYFFFRFAPIAAMGILTVACGGGSSGDGSSSDHSSSSSSSSGGSSCNYPDKITSSERAQANSCGVQVSANYAQADAGLAGVIAACQQGKKSTADAYYSGTYQQMVDYARSVSKSLSCGTNTAPALPNTSAQTYYNLCVVNKSLSNTPSYSGSCYGPFKQGEGGCGSGTNTLVAQYRSLTECKTAGQNWVNSH